MTQGVFGETYASMYDELYEEKAYDAEVDYIESIWSELEKTPTDILDVGCGTGEHGLSLAERGYIVRGIDQSEEMIKLAAQKIDLQGVEEFSVTRRNVTSIDYSEQFDAAIAMFAVMGYLTTNNEIMAALDRIRTALRPGGVLIFDAWYGPAVLTERPEPRFVKKSIENGSIYRYATPELNVRNQTVTVNFDVLRIVDEQVHDQRQEAHEMRFFFENELEALAQITGFKVRSVHPFRELGGAVGESTWNVTWVLERSQT